MKRLLFVVSSVLLLMMINPKNIQASSKKTLIGVWLVSEDSFAAAKLSEDAVHFNDDNTIELGEIKDGKFKAGEKKQVYRDDKQKRELVILNKDGSIDERVSYEFITADKIIASEKEGDTVYLYRYSANKQTVNTIEPKLIGVWRMSEKSLEKAKLSEEGVKFNESGIVELGTIKTGSFIGKEDGIKYSAEPKTKTLIIYKSSGEIDEKVTYTIVSSNIIKLQSENDEAVYLVKFKAIEFVGEPKLIGTWRSSEKSYSDALQNNEAVVFKNDGKIMVGKIKDGKFDADNILQYVVLPKEKIFILTDKDGKEVGERIGYEIVSAGKVKLINKKDDDVLYLVREKITQTPKPILITGDLIGIWKMAEKSSENTEVAIEIAIKFGEDGFLEIGKIDSQQGFTPMVNDKVKYTVDYEAKQFTLYKESGKIDDVVNFEFISKDKLKTTDENGKVIYLQRFK